MATTKQKVLKRRALRLDQNTAHPLYLFSLTGAEILEIADISRVSRDDIGTLLGYQRPEIKSHIQDIVEYLNGESVLFPNSLILALSSQVKFKSSRGPQAGDGLATSGVLEIPISGPLAGKPGWIVDGQQRALAISKSERLDMPIPVNAFIADNVDIQRDQFWRVNNTKPLPRGLISELLPEIWTPLPQSLSIRKIPSTLCDLLHRTPGSPFEGLIRRTSTPSDEKKKAFVTDTPLMKMIHESMSSPSGSLYPHRNNATGEVDLDAMLRTLFIYWGAVKSAFPDDWGLPPHKSRLMHSAGLRAMGKLMDRIMAPINVKDSAAPLLVEQELMLIVPACHWTQGKWSGLNDMNWDEIQNVSRHVRDLSNFLVRTYVQAKGTIA